MERPTRKLWRKIGLQKNFLEGTSHSDQSKNTLSQLQESIIKSHYSKSNHGQENQMYKTQPNYKKFDQNLLNEFKAQKNPVNFQLSSCQTPINRLNASSFQERAMIWQVADDTVDLGKQNQIDQSVVRVELQSAKQSLMYFQSVNMKYGEEKHAESKSKQSGINIARKNPINQDIFGTNHEITGNAARTHRQTDIISDMKIRLHGAQQRQSQTNESQHYTRNIPSSHTTPQSPSTPGYFLQISPKELDRYQNLQTHFHRLKESHLPQIQDSISKLKKFFKYQKTFIIDEIALMRSVMIEYFKNELSEHLQQLTDEIGYLYSENEQLMGKIEEKESVIKKHHEEYTKLQQQLAEFNESLKSDHTHKAETIERLTNEVNKLEQRLQDFQELQTKNEILQTKNQQLENQISLFIANEIKLKEDLQQKTFEASGNIIKNQELEWEINQLYQKNEEIEFRMKREFTEEVERLEGEHVKRLDLEKVFFQKEKLKNKELEALVQYQAVILQESLKHINLQMIEAIHNQFNVIDKNEYLRKVFDNAILEAKQSASRSYHLNHNINKIQMESSQHSPRSDSDNGNSSSKNLRRTGFFGEVTNKPNLNMRLDDIQKRYSTQIPEQDELGSHNHNNQFDQTSNSRQEKKTLFRGDTFSDISQDSVSNNYVDRNRQEFQYRNTRQPNYSSARTPIQQGNRVYSRQKQHSRQESSTIRSSSNTFQNDDSITEDLKRVKCSFEQPEERYRENAYIRSNNFMMDTNLLRADLKNNAQNNYANYSFSQMAHSNTGFDPNEHDDDRSSTTTYEKSDSHYRGGYQNSAHGYHPSNNPNNNSYSSSSYNRQRPPTDRSDTDREDIIEKIKERVKQKLRSKDKYNSNDTGKQPSYHAKEEQGYRRPSYHQQIYNSDKNEGLGQNKRNGQKQDMILADFYQKHSVRNSPIVILAQQTPTIQTEKMISKHSVSRSPSNTRSRSPSSSSTSRVSAVNVNGRVGTSRYTSSIGGSGVSGYTSGLNKTTTNSIKTPISTTPIRSTFSKSLVERPEFVAYSRKNNVTGNNVTPTATYQPKSSRYSTNKGENQFGASSYAKKY